MFRDFGYIYYDDASNAVLIYGAICNHIYCKDRMDLVQETVMTFIIIFTKCSGIMNQ